MILNNSQLSFIQEDMIATNGGDHKGDNEGMLASNGMLTLTTHQEYLKKHKLDDSMAEDTSESTDLSKEGEDQINGVPEDTKKLKEDGTMLAAALVPASIIGWQSVKDKVGFHR